MPPVPPNSRAVANYRVFITLTARSIGNWPSSGPATVALKTVLGAAGVSIEPLIPAGAGHLLGQTGRDLRLRTPGAGAAPLELEAELAVHGVIYVGAADQLLG